MSKLTHWNYPEKIKEILIKLVKVPSISGTYGETLMADELVKIIKGIPYFGNNPENIINYPIINDPLGRSNVFALFQGNQKSSKTVVLLSHFDVVGVDDFGKAKSLAFETEEYTWLLKRELNNYSFNHEVKEDLNSDNYLFGRGVMDMKAGLAVQLAVLSELSQDNEFFGNVLLVATPDEETNSKGMFAAIKGLNELKEKFNLEYEACICSEPNFAAFPQDRSKAVYTGSVGKLLPVIFCVGKETHVGEPLEGVNAGWMASDMVNRLELSNEFVDEIGGEINPPPTCLKISDLKELYNVQTPNLAYVLYNVLTIKQQPSEVLQKVKNICERSSDEIMNRIQEKQLFYPDFPNADLQQLKPKVFTYHELYNKGIEKYGDKFTEEMDKVVQQEDEHGESRDLSVKIGAKMAEIFQEYAPFYLIYFSPPYYPHVHLDKQYARDRKLKQIIREVSYFAKSKYKTDIKVRNFFTGLSDVSYCRVFNPDDVITTFKENMPLFEMNYKLPIEEMKKLNLPTINIGPFGKDAHKNTERLELDYSTNVVPFLVKKAIELIIKEEKNV